MQQKEFLHRIASISPRKDNYWKVTNWDNLVNVIGLMCGETRELDVWWNQRRVRIIYLTQPEGGQLQSGGWRNQRGLNPRTPDKSSTESHSLPYTDGKQASNPWLVMEKMMLMMLRYMSSRKYVLRYNNCTVLSKKSYHALLIIFWLWCDNIEFLCSFFLCTFDINLRIDECSNNNDNKYN